MIYIKINETLYSASINGRLVDRDWDDRDSKSIDIEMDYTTAINLFVNGLSWSIVLQNEVPVYNKEGLQIGVELVEEEYDNSEYNLAGDITDHRDGTITVKMGKLTPLEEAYEIMFGGNN